MSGLLTSMNGLKEALPMQDAADIVSLTLTGNELQRVAERNEPALTAHRTHLTNVVHVYNRVAMNALELASSQAFSDHAQRLRGQEPLFRGDDPHQFALRLKRQNLVRVQQHVFLAVPADYFARLNRRNPSDITGD